MSPSEQTKTGPRVDEDSFIRSGRHLFQANHWHSIKYLRRTCDGRGNLRRECPAKKKKKNDGSRHCQTCKTNSGCVGEFHNHCPPTWPMLFLENGLVQCRVGMLSVFSPNSGHMMSTPCPDYPPNDASLSFNNSGIVNGSFARTSVRLILRKGRFATFALDRLRGHKDMVNGCGGSGHISNSTPPCPLSGRKDRPARSPPASRRPSIFQVPQVADAPEQYAILPFRHEAFHSAVRHRLGCD